MNISFQKVFFAIATAFALFAILIVAKPVLVPLAFSVIISFILFPIAKRFERWGANRIMASFLSILALFILIGGGIYLFSTQIIQLSENLTEFKDKIIGVFTDVTLFINKNISFAPQIEKGELLEKLKELVNDSIGPIVNQTFNGSVAFFSGALIAIVFTFLILLYRDGLVNAFTHFYPRENRDRALNMFKSVQQVGKKYLFGMFVIVLILGFVNSIGLWIIGIDSPFLFGFLAATLAIVPYAGTVTGAAIPVLYAFLTYDSVWMPLSIIIFFWVVQFIESNYLSPKIVGGNLQLNALATILSIFIGATVWGVAGMILFLPFTAMLRVICEEYQELKPIAMLINDFNGSNKKKGDDFLSKGFKNIKGKLTK